jgi:menaquinone-specific isochorismate synthase
MLNEDDMTLAPAKIKRMLKEKQSSLGPSSDSFIHRITIPIDETDILYWLFQQENHLKFYYRDPKSQFEIGGFGAAHVIRGNSYEDYRKIFQNALPGADAVRYYGGMRFDQKQTHAAEWQYFGGYYFFVPKFEIVSFKGNYHLAYNFTNQAGNDLEDLPGMAILPEKSIFIQPQLISYINTPEFETWSGLIELVLKKIADQCFSKIVLARKTLLTFDGYLDAYSIIRRLKRSLINSVLFLFQPESEIAFVGATPELLYRRKDKKIYSEVIAGTRPRGKNLFEDKRLAEDLIQSHKERHEHRIVFDSVMDAFHLFCRTVDISNPDVSILQLNRVQHLYNAISGTLKEETTDADIISLLHPTPAVGGYPKEESLNFISQIESFDRGWYAAPIGWFNKKDANFSVAIRSGIIHRNTLSLFSGAGIVNGSQAKKEWDETESKIFNFLRAVNVHGTGEKYQHPLGMLDYRRTYKERY